MYSKCILKSVCGVRSDCPMLGVCLGNYYCLSTSFNCAFKTSDKVSLKLENFTPVGDIYGFKRSDIIAHFVNGGRYSDIFKKLCDETPLNHIFISKYLEIIVKQLAINKRLAAEIWNRKE